jgi:Putative Ser protein kinase
VRLSRRKCLPIPKTSCRSFPSVRKVLPTMNGNIRTL